MLIAQISDCHITEPGGLVAERVDSAPGLERAVAYLVGLGDAIDLIVASGDLANDGRPGEYDRLAELLAPLAALRADLVGLPGNHDDRAEVRSRFALVPDGDGPIDHVVERDGYRVVCLDTTVPGRPEGNIIGDQLAWLDTVLGERPDTPAVVAQHHPPFASGIASMDKYGLAGADAEADVLVRHPQVAGVVAGHYHRPITRAVGGTVAFACPSTAVQIEARLGGGNTTYTTEPPALALHRLVEGSLTTHVVQLLDADRWVPTWAAG